MKHFLFLQNEEKKKSRINYLKLLLNSTSIDNYRQRICKKGYLLMSI